MNADTKLTKKYLKGMEVAEKGQIMFFCSCSKQKEMKRRGVY